jgi:hypothetical protein
MTVPPKALWRGFGLSGGPGAKGGKSEIRNPKSETSTKFKCPNSSNQHARKVWLFLNYKKFEFDSDFAFRISDLSKGLSTRSADI